MAVITKEPVATGTDFYHWKWETMANGDTGGK